MNNISRYHKCLQFTSTLKNPQGPDKFILLLMTCKSSPNRGISFFLPMQMYVGSMRRSIRSKGPYWIADLLSLGSPDAGSKCLSYKLPLDINIRKTFGPALTQVKAQTQPHNAAVQQRQAEINSLQTHRKCAPAVTQLACFPFMPTNPVFCAFRHPPSII